MADVQSRSNVFISSHNAPEFAVLGERRFRKDRKLARRLTRSQWVLYVQQQATPPSVAFWKNVCNDEDCLMLICMFGMLAGGRQGGPLSRLRGFKRTKPDKGEAQPIPHVSDKHPLVSSRLRPTAETESRWDLVGPVL